MTTIFSKQSLNDYHQSRQTKIESSIDKMELDDFSNSKEKRLLEVILKKNPAPTALIDSEGSNNVEIRQVDRNGASFEAVVFRVAYTGDSNFFDLVPSDSALPTTLDSRMVVVDDQSIEFIYPRIDNDTEKLKKRFMDDLDEVKRISKKLVSDLEYYTTKISKFVQVKLEGKHHNLKEDDRFRKELLK